jgi:hypothetical protein
MKYLILIGILTISNQAKLLASDSTKVCLHPIKNGGKWGYADNDGKCVTGFVFDSALAFSEGLALIEVKNLWGFIDHSGRIIIKPQFFNAESFSNGLAKIWLKDSKYPTAFIDISGKILFRCKYLEVTSFKFQRARVFIHNKVCYLNTKGKVVIKTSFPYGGVFYEGIAQVWTENSAKFIDTNGRRIAYFYEMGHSDFSEGTASVLNNDHHFYINSVGAKIQVASRSFYIDKMGNPTITKTVDSLVYFSFSNGMAEICVPGIGHKSGFIDSTGKMVVPVIYDEVTPFVNGFARVWRDGKSHLIDKKGNEVVPKDRSMHKKACDCE